MSSLRTVYRVVVMIAAGVIVVKGWQLYGPSTDKVKSFAVAAFEKAQAAWNSSAEGPESEAAIADPRMAAPKMVATDATVVAEAAPPPLMATAPNATIEPITTPGPAENAPQAASPAVGTVDNTAPLLTRLQEMGGTDAQVVEWGSSGELFRCSCRAKLAEESLVARHFEAVANERVAAVEQVVAKVEAWRTEQQSLLR